MAYLNVKDRTIEAKLVYYGAGLSGKTTNLEKVKSLSQDGRCGDMMTLDTDGDRTLFFDWLPFNIGKFNGCDVKLQLYTVPGQAKYAETRRRVLASADGVVLVLDSQSGALQKNVEILADLRDHMRANDLKWGSLPVVVQLNKRDLPTAMPPAELMNAVGIGDLSFVEAVAAKGEGVFETLREATRLMLISVREAARTRDPELRSGDASGLDGKTLYAQLTETAPPASAARPSAAEAASVNGAAASSPVKPAPVVAEARSAAPVASSPAKPPPVVAEARSGAATAGAPPTVAQLGELVTGQRNLARRLDAIEASVSQNITASILAMEKRLLAKMTPTEDRDASGQRLVEGYLEPLKNEVAGVLHEVTARHEQLSTALEASQRTLTSTLARHESQLMEALTRATSDASKEVIAGYTKQQQASDLASSEAQRSTQTSVASAHATLRAALEAATAKTLQGQQESFAARVEQSLGQRDAAAAEARKLEQTQREALAKRVTELASASEHRQAALLSASERAIRAAVEAGESARESTERAIAAAASAAQAATTAALERQLERTAQTERAIVHALGTIEEHLEAGLSSHAQKIDVEALRSALLKSLTDLRVSLPTHQQIVTFDQSAERRYLDLRAQSVNREQLEESFTRISTRAVDAFAEKLTPLENSVEIARDATVAAQAESRRTLETLTQNEQRRGERIQEAIERSGDFTKEGVEKIHTAMVGLAAVLRPVTELLQSTLRAVQETRATVTETSASTSATLSETWNHSEERFKSLGSQVREALDSIGFMVTEMQSAKKSWWK